MFQSLRPNSPLFVLHKGDNPKLENGFVVNVSMPRPKYTMPQTFQNQEMVVDIVARINNLTVNYNNLPASLDIADSFNGGETVTIADNRDAMNSEVINLKQKSEEILNSIDTHTQLVKLYDNILDTLNPEIAEKKQQQDEISTLKKQMQNMTASIEELMQANRSLMDQLSKK